MRGKPLCSRPPTAGNRITPAGAGKTHLFFRHAGNVQDHPRRCGENSSADSTSSVRKGSPPQVRGKPDTKARRAVVSRITPAGAGKTVLLIVPALFLWDHPRRCGENRTRRNIVKRILGSPPQVRGKQVSALRFSFKYGITPAGAGKTSHSAC